MTNTNAVKLTAFSAPGNATLLQMSQTAGGVEASPGKIAIAVDRSGSMEKYMYVLRDILLKIVQGPAIPDGTELHIASFDEEIDSLLDTNSLCAADRSNAANAIRCRLTERYMTNIGLAFQHMHKVCPGGVHILLTDGVPNCGATTSEALASLARFPGNSKGRTAFAVFNPQCNGMPLLTALAELLKEMGNTNETFYCTEMEGVDGVLGRVVAGASNACTFSGELMVQLENREGQLVGENLYVASTYSEMCKDVYVELPPDVVAKHGPELHAVVYVDGALVCPATPLNIGTAGMETAPPPKTVAMMGKVCDAVAMVTDKMSRIDANDYGEEDFVRVEEELAVVYRSLSTDSAVQESAMAVLVTNDVKRVLDFARGAMPSKASFGELDPAATAFPEYPDDDPPRYTSLSAAAPDGVGSDLSGPVYRSLDGGAAAAPVKAVLTPAALAQMRASLPRVAHSGSVRMAKQQRPGKSIFDIDPDLLDDIVRFLLDDPSAVMNLCFANKAFYPILCRLHEEIITMPTTLSQLYVLYNIFRSIYVNLDYRAAKNEHQFVFHWIVRTMEAKGGVIPGLFSLIGRRSGDRLYPKCRARSSGYHLMKFELPSKTLRDFVDFVVSKKKSTFKKRQNLHKRVTFHKLAEILGFEHTSESRVSSQFPYDRAHTAVICITK